MSPLEEIKRLPDETYEKYFERAVKKAKEENKSFVIEIFHRYVDVTPETTYDYLKGFFEAYLGPLH
ncbi:hypothetical protein D4S03_05090 [bacterium]|nr:MAG: hypothetical protein D4S03_05090 [bacterium]